MGLLTSAITYLSSMPFLYVTGLVYDRLKPGFWTHRHQGDEGIAYYTNLRNNIDCEMKCQGMSDCDGYIWNDNHMCEVLSNVNFCPIPHQTDSYYSNKIKEDEASGGE